MTLPPAQITTDPTPDMLALASVAHMEYRRIYVGGKFLYWKLYHKKTKKDCGCNG